MEQLLNDDENSRLDFKVAQYNFVGATDDKKAELLKDIIAFANAWRNEDAYILIGVEEVKGGKSIVVGETNHLDEASIQQFINSKANRAVEFSHRIFPFEGKKIGIIRIPVQKRPFFLKKDFGNLKKGIVYIRRGSSTDMNGADPEEIARMGEAATSANKEPSVELQFVEPKDKTLLGNSITIACLAIDMPAREDIPTNVQRKPSSPFDVDIMSRFTSYNEDYYKEYSDFFYFTHLQQQIKITMKNTGPIILNNARLNIIIPDNNDTYCLTEDEMPDVPIYSENLITPSYSNRTSAFKHKTITVETINNNYHVWIEFGNVQPKASSISDVIYLGSKVSTDISFIGTVYADNLSEPIEIPLTISIKTERTSMDLDGLYRAIKHYQELRRNSEE